VSDPARRAAHLAELGGAPGAANPPEQAAQGKAEHAAELFQRACDAEVKGDRDSALTLFAAAVRVDGQPRYLRRAARCALKTGRLELAERYAVRAAELRAGDASYARVLADVHRASGQLDRAEEVLVRALELPNASDVLVREMEGDLAAIRSMRRSEFHE
jgi:tetratricopeptide (TPR) repeat protein